MQTLEFGAIPPPCSPTIGIDLFDLQTIATPDKTDRVIVAKGIRGAGDKAVQLYLVQEHALKRIPQVMPCCLSRLRREEEWRQMHRDGGMYMVFGHRQRPVGRRFQFPVQEVVDGIPHLLCGCGLFCPRIGTKLRQVRHEVLKGVETRIDQHVERQKLIQHTLAHFNCGKTLSVGEIKNIEDAAQFGNVRRRCSQLIEFRASRRMLSQNETRIPDRSADGLGYRRREFC